MTLDAQGVIQALSRAVEVSPLHSEQTLQPVITLSREEYVNALITVVRSMYHKGGIIIGRGASCYLAKTRCLACAFNRIQTSLRKTCRQTNKTRSAFVWNMFNSRLNDPANFDLTINTDHFAHYDQVVEIIPHTMTMMDYTQRRTGTTRR